MACVVNEIQYMFKLMGKLIGLAARCSNSFHGMQQMLMQEKTITYIDQMILQKNLII